MKRKTSIAGVMVVAMAALAQAAAGAADAVPHLFDFGTASSPVWAGFKQVTHKTLYTRELGYGWDKTDRLRSLAAGGRSSPGAPDALMGDYVHANGRDFVVDAPRAQYRAVAYVDGYQLHGRVRFRGYRIRVAGKDVARFDWTHDQFLSSDYFFKDWDRDFDPEDAVWERWADKLHRTETFDVTPVNGRIRINFSRDMQVFGLIIYPTDKEGEAKKAIERLDERRKQEFYETFFPRAIPEPEPLPRLSASDQARGYLVSSRHVFEPIGFHAAPKREEMNRPLEMFASLGEYETASFTVLPLADLEKVTVSVGDLRGTNSAIPASALKLECLRYRWAKSGPNVSPRGVILMPWTSVSAPKRYNRRFFLTVKVPPKTQAGIYSGEVRIAVSGRPTMTLPVRLRVLPFRLPTITQCGLSAGYYYYPARQTFYFDRMNNVKSPLWEKWIERDLRLMKDYNLNGFQAQSYSVKVLDYDKLAAGDPASIDFSMLDRDLAICRKMGMDGAGLIFTQFIHNALVGSRLKLKMDSEAYAVRARSFFQLLGEHVRKQGGPELAAWLTDEVRETGLQSWNLNHDKTLRLCRMVKAAPGIRTSLTLMSDRGGNKDYTDLVPACDVTQTHFWDKSARIIETANKGGHELWSYNSGRSRYSWGVQVYRLNGKGRWQWHYYTIIDRPYSPVTLRRYAVVYFTPDTILPTPAIVESREGLDDYRYIKMLEQLLQKGTGSAEARRDAQKALDDVRNLPPFGIKLAGGAAVGGRAAGVFPSNADYDRLRWRIARAIMGLAAEADKD